MAKPTIQRVTLTFDDLPLQEAVFKLFRASDFVRSEALLIGDAGREWVLQKLIAYLPHEYVGHYTFERMLLSVNQFRKLNKEHLAKRLIILEHARNQKDATCFYKGKVATTCTDYVDLDRVKPGKRSGEYVVGNTVLSCSRHNRERGCKEVVNYWSQ